MQRKQAHPAGDVQDVLVGVVTLDGDFVGDVVDSDDAVKKHQRNED